MRGMGEMYIVILAMAALLHSTSCEGRGECWSSLDAVVCRELV